MQLKNFFFLFFKGSRMVDMCMTTGSRCKRARPVAQSVRVTTHNFLMIRGRQQPELLPASWRRLVRGLCRWHSEERTLQACSPLGGRASHLPIQHLSVRHILTNLSSEVINIDDDGDGLEKRVGEGWEAVVHASFFASFLTHYVYIDNHE